jgi:hypothetical protein
MKLKSYGPVEFLEAKILQSGTSEKDGISLTNVSVSANPLRDYYPEVDNVFGFSLEDLIGSEEFREFVANKNVPFFCLNYGGVTELFHRRENKIDSMIQVPSINLMEIKGVVVRSQKNMLAFCEFVDSEPGVINLSFSYVNLPWEN